MPPPPRFPHLVFFADVVQVKTPGMGPDSAEYLEILEELCPGPAPPPLQRSADTCAEIGGEQGGRLVAKKPRLGPPQGQVQLAPNAECARVGRGGRYIKVT